MYEGDEFLGILPGAEPFLLPGGEKGVLLVHGFTGSPSEMRLMGEALQAEGYTVLAPRLCGHGTTVSEMAVTRWPHWYGSVQDGYHLLKAMCSEISIVGLSMGGLFALQASQELPVKKVVSLATPIFINNRRLPLLPLYRIFRKYVYRQKKEYPGIDPCYTVSYEQTPIACLDSMLALIDHVDSLLPNVSVPALIIQSHNDHTVRPRSAKHIYDRLGSQEKTLLWLEHSGHLMTLDIEHAAVFAAVIDFLRD